MYQSSSATRMPQKLIPTQKITKSKKAFSALVNDINRNGIREAIKYVEVNGDKYVVDGHHRLLAAKMLGLDKILSVDEATI